MKAKLTTSLPSFVEGIMANSSLPIQEQFELKFRFVEFIQQILCSTRSVRRRLVKENKELFQKIGIPHGFVLEVKGKLIKF